jgi:hypothetical protein
MKLRLSWRYFLQQQNAGSKRAQQYYERTILKHCFPPHITLLRSVLAQFAEHPSAATRMYNRSHTEHKMKNAAGMNLDAKNTGSPAYAVRRSHRVVRAALLSVVLAALPLAAQNAKDSGAQQSSSDNDSIGFNLGKNASAKDVGLPIYPGARRHIDDANDSSALNMGLWGGSSGFKLFVLKMESSDAPEKVAAFYRKALAKYGTVLDCSAASAANEASADKSSKKLSCEDEKPKAGEISLKAGSKEKQHAVGIEANGSGATFQLVYIEMKGTD